ncbi:MAG TPA: DUF72 domain-containing protein [Acidimicrobiales bacterium]|jgi:uncharacterized protein YecE (DUF72 family)|nr:DUF72 domain-containing protein [Acidimicrobiales bacterium]
MTVHVGTSGWQYRDWKGPFYPTGVKQADWLGFYAQHFATVEVNNAFYRLPEASLFSRWADQLPDGFVMAVKASRYLTHVKRLHDPEEPVQRLMSRARCLGPKLGPVLLQLPPNLPAHLGDLAATLDAFGPDVRVAVELRHPSWFADDTAEDLKSLLTGHDAALCLADSPRRRTPRWRTAGWGYLRLHEGRASPRPCYGRQALRSWASHLEELWGPGEDVYVYFNNDPGACAVRNARTFSRMTQGG